MHFRYLVFFYLRKRENTAQTVKKVCDVFDDGAIAMNIKMKC